MKLFEAALSPLVADFLVNALPRQTDYAAANARLQAVCGIETWFGSEGEFQMARAYLVQSATLAEEDRTEYGDFQTNDALACRVVDLLKKQSVAPQTVIEPTCGKGAFLLAALRVFPGVQRLYGIEIYRPYVWEAKFRVLHHFLENPTAPKPRIRLVHADVFDFPFKTIRPESTQDQLLLLGNPPWVTNAQLGSLNSTNLPTKSNFKGINGLDALTGKGNFDLGEFIVLTLLDAFGNWPGHVAMLVKNAVIRNVVYGLRKHPRPFGNAKLYRIDAKKEFNAAVEAALLVGTLGAETAQTCGEFDLAQPNYPLNGFGWIGEKFVAQTETYRALQGFDGLCPIEWRQGLKHDCSAVMELEAQGIGYVNSLGEAVRVEPELVYGLLKSSDLKGEVITSTRKFVVVPQQRVGQDTRYLQDQFPQTYHYLKQHEGRFAARKSSIYRGKPAFSIFGIGEYSFKPFKVALSGLYKTPRFALVLPIGDKPVMLDDTCYFLGFDNRIEAVCTWLVLNHSLTQHLLAALAFPDAKRPYTKELLMRLDLPAISRRISFAEMEDKALAVGLTQTDWLAYTTSEVAPAAKQMVLFG